MSKIKRLETSNAAFEGDVIHTVDPLGGHSSEVPSTDHFDADAGHAQFDDAEDNISPLLDPNISGTHGMLPMHSEKAGELNDWSENQDYRLFQETGVAVESALLRSSILVQKQKNWKQADGDYDDDSGIPTAIDSYSGSGNPDNKPDYESGWTRDDVNDFPVDVVQRRI